MKINNMSYSNSFFRSQFSVFLFTYLVLLQFSVSGTSRNTLHQNTVFSMDTLSEAVLQEGVAGSYFGKQGAWFLLAGGSSFPEGKPWEGGSKFFSNRVLVFEQSGSGALNLVYESQDLPLPFAEGASLTVPGGLLCIGGNTPDGLSERVFLLAFDGVSVTVNEFPSLPLAVRASSAALVGSTVYLLGGEQADGRSSDQFLSLDLNRIERGWEVLRAYPKPVSGAALAVQQDGEQVSLFAFGGRAKLPADALLSSDVRLQTDDTSIGLTTFYASVYHYHPIRREWTMRNPIRLKSEGDPGSFQVNNSASNDLVEQSAFQQLPLALATAFPVGASHVLIYGGDDGVVFNQVERAIHEGRTSDRDSLWKHHSGFNARIMVYNTITDTWFEAASTAQEPVAVSAGVLDGRNIYIASGEIRPGVRSPLITQLYYSSQPSFGWLNYVVLILYFGGMLLLGFFFMKRNNNTEDFFKASGRIPWWAAGISIFATTLSAITFLSIPAKTYAMDWRMLTFNLTILLIVPVVIRYFLPFFRRFNFGTAYEYLEVRFNRAVRWLASALFVFFMVSRIAIVLFLPSLALNAVTGFDIYLSIIVMGVVTIIYSTSGGMEAVVWGDVIQGFILVFGAIFALIFMIAGIEGGFSEFWTTSIDYHKFHTFDLRLDFTQPVFWVVLIGGVANSLITYTSDQSVVQRYMTTKDEKATSRSIWLNGILSVPVTILFFLIGTGLFAFYSANPSNMILTNPNIDSVFPQFIVAELPVGIAGLLIAAVFAAAMSTLSSNINSSAAVITSDFYKTIFPKKSFASQMHVARWSGIVCGLLGIGMALVLATWNIASLWDQFNTFLGLLTSGLGAFFILGIFFKRVGAPAALIGVITGLIILVIVKNKTELSFLLYGLIGMVSGIVIALFVSLFIPNKKEGYTYSSL
jgi:SSS family solute:Na+ symporter